MSGQCAAKVSDCSNPVSSPPPVLYINPLSARLRETENRRFPAVSATMLLTSNGRETLISALRLPILSGPSDLADAVRRAKDQDICGFSGGRKVQQFENPPLVQTHRRRHGTLILLTFLALSIILSLLSHSSYPPATWTLRPDTP